MGRMKGHGYWLIKKTLDMSIFLNIRRPRRLQSVSGVVTGLVRVHFEVWSYHHMTYDGNGNIRSNDSRD